MTPSPLRILHSLLRHLIVPWCVAVVFLAVVSVASWLLGLVIVALFFSPYRVGGGLETLMIGTSLGWGRCG